MDWESLDKKMGQENSILRTFCCCCHHCNTESRKHILLCFVNIHTKPRPHEKGTETKLFFPHAREQSQRARRNIRGVFWDAQSSPGPWDVHSMLELWMASVFVLWLFIIIIFILYDLLWHLLVKQFISEAVHMVLCAVLWYSGITVETEVNWCCQYLLL